MLPDSLYLLDPALRRQVLARPERLRGLLAGSAGARTVVIDEIQRVPELLSVIHSVQKEPGAPRLVPTG